MNSQSEEKSSPSLCFQMPENPSSTMTKKVNCERENCRLFISAVQMRVRGNRQTIFVTVNGIGPSGGKGVQLKSVKNFTFVTKIEISNILSSILKE